MESFSNAKRQGSGTQMAKKILIVEDDNNSRESLRKILLQSGHAVEAAWSAEEAKSKLAGYTPDVALLDVRLPGMPGDALGIYLQNKFPGVKIIFISGDFYAETSSRFGPNVQAFPKPIDVEKLLEAIEQ